MARLLSLFIAAVFSIISVTATYIINFQGNVLDLAYNEVTDLSVVNAHYLTLPAQSNQNWTLCPASNGTIIQNVLSKTYLSYGAPDRLEYSQTVIQGNRPLLLTVQSFNATHSFILDINSTYALTAWAEASGLFYPPVTFEKVVSLTSPVPNQLWTFQN